MNRRFVGCRAGKALAAVALAALVAHPAPALDFEKGEFRWSWDTTLSYGAAWRVEDRDERLIGVANGGTANSVNYDDGDLNYDTGLFSNALKATTELEFTYKRFGAFFRGFGLYDYENEQGERARTPLSDEALDLVGTRVELRDAFFRLSFDIGDRAAEVRVGEQVVSWGESTFIQNSINVINPVDVSALRVPGSELREALLPVGMLWANLATSTNGSLELFYQWDWESVIIEPTGSYFSTNDFAGDGGSRVLLGFGADADDLPVSSQLVIQRDPDIEPSEGGQYGIAYRHYVPALNDTELGFYFINYHSRLPLISGRTGSAEAAAAGRYIEDSAYLIAYPEDIKLLGASYSTVGGGGVAFQGELSYRMDAPLQIDDVELLAAALSPALPFLGPLVQLGQMDFDQFVQGWIERDVAQFQTTATKVFGPGLGANESLLIGEIGVTHVLDFPDKDELRMDAPGTYTSGNPALTQIGIQPATTDEDMFADATSAGYALAGRLVYNNAIGGVVDLIPLIAWQHDVVGISPGPGGNFIEGRKAVTVGLDASYRQVLGAELRYTSYMGAGSQNLLRDRDFTSLTFKYSF